MKKYTDEYLHEHDIDWFCTINGKPIHAASNGGTLPLIIKNNKSINEENQFTAYNRPYNKALRISVNNKYLNMLFKKDDNTTDLDIQIRKTKYLRTFVDMARRGFYSFDRRYYDKYRSNLYIPIAWPIFDDKYTEDEVNNKPNNGFIGEKFTLKDFDPIHNDLNSLKTYNFSLLGKK